MTGTRDSELATVRRLAEEMAKERGERATTGHLLAAIAPNAGGAVEQGGSDVVKLRPAAMQLAMGIVGPRRLVRAAAQLPLHPPAGRPIARIAVAQQPAKPAQAAKPEPVKPAPAPAPKPHPV